MDVATPRIARFWMETCVIFMLMFVGAVAVDDELFTVLFLL